MVGVKGSRVQPAPGGTTSRWETRASVGPGRPARTSIRTEVSSRTASRPHPRARPSRKSATAASSPLTDGMATSSSSSFSSSGKIHPEVRRLLLAPDDHRPTTGAGEDLEEERVGRAPVDDMSALDATGGRTDASFDLGPHPAAQHTAGHEAREVVGVREGDEGGGVVPVA